MAWFFRYFIISEIEQVPKCIITYMKKEKMMTPSQEAVLSSTRVVAVAVVVVVAV